MKAMTSADELKKARTQPTPSPSLAIVWQVKSVYEVKGNGSMFMGVF